MAFIQKNVLRFFASSIFWSEDYLPTRNPPAVVRLAEHVCALSDERVRLVLDPVLVDQETAAHLDLARIIQRRQRRSGSARC